MPQEARNADRLHRDQAGERLTEEVAIGRFILESESSKACRIRVQGNCGMPEISTGRFDQPTALEGPLELHPPLFETSGETNGHSHESGRDPGGVQRIIIHFT